MRIAFNIRVEYDLERESGKFASKDEIADQIQDEIETTLSGAIAEVSGVGADGDSTYIVNDESFDISREEG